MMVGVGFSGDMVSDDDISLLLLLLDTNAF
jgi:hypothetical protein